MTLGLDVTLQAAVFDFHLDVTAAVPAGRCLVVMGANGSGKTTLMRLLAGVQIADSGTLIVNGQTWFDGHRRFHLPPQKRATACVLQGASVFPHMTTAANLRFAARARCVSAKECVADLMREWDLVSIANQPAAALSAGQLQRVALARCCVQPSKLLLLDEPFTALDREWKERARAALKQYAAQNGAVMVLVSHDLDDVATLADHVLLMRAGRGAGLIDPRTDAGLDAIRGAAPVTQQLPL